MCLRQKTTCPSAFTCASWGREGTIDCAPHVRCDRYSHIRMDDRRKAMEGIVSKATLAARHGANRPACPQLRQAGALPCLRSSRSTISQFACADLRSPANWTTKCPIRRTYRPQAASHLPLQFVYRVAHAVELDASKQLWPFGCVELSSVSHPARQSCLPPETCCALPATVTPCVVLTT